MKNNKKLLIQGATIFTGISMLALIVIPGFAHAEGAYTTSSTTIATRQQKLQTKGSSETEARITSLNQLISRINSLINVPSDDKSSLESNLQTEITDLTNLESRIATATNTTTLKNDDASITESYRVYALVMPQARIIAAADRAETIAGMLNAVATQLQSRITSIPSGTNTTAWQTSLTDLQAKTADAITQAKAAIALVTPLVPDQGDATVMTSNKTALTNARADIKNASTDLTAARSDAKSVILGITASTH